MILLVDFIWLKSLLDYFLQSILDVEYHERIEEHKNESERKTAKKRKKRQKHKEKKKQAKDKDNEKNSESESEIDENELKEMLELNAQKEKALLAFSTENVTKDDDGCRWLLIFWKNISLFKLFM